MRAATDEEVERVVERMATAPFDPRIRGIRQEERGITYQGRTVGAREESLFYHLAKRVVDDEQWAAGTTASQYLDDLRRGVRSADARLTIHVARGGHIAATATPTLAVVSPARQGLRTLPNLLVIYSADRGIIVTGCQFSTPDQVRIPPEARWLK